MPFFKSKQNIKKLKIGHWTFWTFWLFWVLDLENKYIRAKGYSQTTLTSKGVIASTKVKGEGQGNKNTQNPVNVVYDWPHRHSFVQPKVLFNEVRHTTPDMHISFTHNLLSIHFNDILLINIYRTPMPPGCDPKWAWLEKCT